MFSTIRTLAVRLIREALAARYVFTSVTWTEEKVESIRRGEWCGW